MRVIVTLSLVVLAAHCQIVLAQSRLTGDTYTFSSANFPTNIGQTVDPVSGEETDHGSDAVELRFDGIAEVAGGMLVNERTFEWDGGEIIGEQASGVDGEFEAYLADWELPGEVVEFSFETLDGSWIAGNPTGQSTFTLKGLDWANSDAFQFPLFYQTGFYFYWTVNGTPVSSYETQQPDIGLLVGPHPFDETVPAVTYIAYSAGQVDEITDPYEGGVDFTFGTSQLDEENGSYALLAQVMSLDPLGSGANGFHVGMLVDPPPGDPIELTPGDFNADGLINVADFDIMANALATGSQDAQFDLNSDSSINTADRDTLVTELANTFYGDSNFDLEFNSGDFVAVFTAGQYEDGVPGNSTWATGDWNGDGEFDSGDFVLAFTQGGYEQGPRTGVASVPEPSCGCLAALGLLTSFALIRRRGTTR